MDKIDTNVEVVEDFIEDNVVEVEDNVVKVEDIVVEFGEEVLGVVGVTRHV